MVESAEWTNAEHTIVRATVDGVEWHCIHMTEQGELQRHVQKWIDDGNEPGPFVPQPGMIS
jgi:hypothetical protein